MRRVGAYDNFLSFRDAYDCNVTNPDNYFVWLYQFLHPLSMFYLLFRLYKFLELHLKSFHHSLLFSAMDLMNFCLQVSNPVASHLIKILDRGTWGRPRAVRGPSGAVFTWRQFLLDDLADFISLATD